MEQSPFPLAHMESPWVGELQPPTPATLDMDLWDKQPGLVWSLMEEPQETGVEVNQFVRVSGLISTVNEAVLKQSPSNLHRGDHLPLTDTSN